MSASLTFLLRGENNMTVTLMKNSSDRKVLDKHLTTVTTVNAHPLDDCSLLQPRLVLRYSANIELINFMYIPEFKRYYFAKCTVQPGGQIEITGEIDYLTTYKDAIKNTDVLLDRTADENLSNLYFVDEKMRKYAYERVQNVLFPLDPLNRDGYCILITAGGAAYNGGGE